MNGPIRFLDFRSSTGWPRKVSALSTAGNELKVPLKKVLLVLRQVPCGVPRSLVCRADRVDVKTSHAIEVVLPEVIQELERVEAVVADPESSPPSLPEPSIKRRALGTLGESPAVPHFQQTAPPSPGCAKHLVKEVIDAVKGASMDREKLADRILSDVVEDFAKKAKR